MDFVWASFANSLVLGLSIGSIWLIAALGLTIIYGTAGVINMAHGEFIMLGAYSAYCLQAFFGVPFLLCLPLSFLIVGLIGLIIERVLVRYLYARPLDTLLATWGVSLVLMQGVRIIFGSEPKYIRMPEFLSSNLTVGPLSLSSSLWRGRLSCAGYLHRRVAPTVMSPCGRNRRKTTMRMNSRKRANVEL